MKSLGQTIFCLGLQVHYLPNGSILLHQQAYVMKILKAFQMDQANPLSVPIIRHSKINGDLYHPCEEKEKIVDKSKCLIAVGVFIYLTMYTKPDIAFITSILAKHSKKPTSRHWNGVKHLMKYLRGTRNLGLYYHKINNYEIMGFATFVFRTDETADKSQTRCIFLIMVHPFLGNPLN